MNDSENIDTKVKNILAQLEHNEPQFQSVALRAFNNLLNTSELSYNQKESIIPILKNILNDPTTPLKTECIQTICNIGSRTFKIIEPIFLDLIEEFRKNKKNRFRIKIIMNMISTIRNSKNPVIQDFIRDLLKNSSNWFDTSALKEILKDFWSCENDLLIPFIDNYLQDIETSIKTYPEEFRDLKELINEKIRIYNENICLLKKLKENEQNKRLIILKENRESINNNTERLDSKAYSNLNSNENEFGKIPINKVDTASNNKNEIKQYQNIQNYHEVGNDETIDQNNISHKEHDQNETPINPYNTASMIDDISVNNEDISNNNRNNNEDNNDEIIDDLDSNPFTTFTKLGLKKKNPNNKK